MTDKEREEAIAVLKAIIPKDSRGNGKVLNTLAITKAILMAIEVLEQQPCEDCISRKKVINTIFYKSDNNCDVVLSLDLMDRIKHLPSVTPQPKTGQWEYIQYDANPSIGNWHCSECSCILRGEINENPIRLPKYCPECGARMEANE